MRRNFPLPIALALCLCGAAAATALAQAPGTTSAPRTGTASAPGTTPSAGATAYTTGDATAYTAGDATAQIPQAQADEIVARAETELHDADVLYNRGLVAAHADRTGEALLWFERAALADPFDRSIQDALLATRKEARKRSAENALSATIVQGEPALVARWRLFHAVPEALCAWSLLAVSALLTLALFDRRRTSVAARRDFDLVVSIVLVLAGATLAVYWAMERYTDRTVRPAIVVSTEPAGREAPDELSRARRDSNLYEGAMTRLVESRGGWDQVELVDGELLWVARGTVEPVRR